MQQGLRIRTSILIHTLISPFKKMEAIDYQFVEEEVQLPRGDLLTIGNYFFRTQVRYNGNLGRALEFQIGNLDELTAKVFKQVTGEEPATTEQVELGEFYSLGDIKGNQFGFTPLGLIEKGEGVKIGLLIPRMHKSIAIGGKENGR